MAAATYSRGLGMDTAIAAPYEGAMGLGLFLYGDTAKPRDALLEQAAAWVHETHRGLLRSSHVGEGEDGHRTLWLALHPAEEPLELKAIGRDKVLALARTSGAGPGYHAFVCELLDAMSQQLSIRWQGPDPTGETGDETGFFHQRDRSKLEAEMRGWVRAVARSLTQGDIEGWQGIAISLPVSAPQYDIEGAATALGPRSGAFFRQLADDDAQAQRFFSWWEPGFGAEYLLGRALCRMWADVRWRKPVNDAERAVHDEVLDLLARAFAVDPSRDYPFAEWGELLALRGETLPAPAAARVSGTPTIGYRRGSLIMKPFPGASIRIPGCFSEKVDPRGSWIAWDDGRTIWLSLLAGKARAAAGATPLDESEPMRDQVTENGRQVHRVQGKRVSTTADEVRVLLVSILFTDEAQADWAFDTWRSVSFR
jgi:hypothetical protein